MARKRPEYNEYSGINAEEYGSSRWMKKNQIEVTQRALELLESSLFDNQEIGPESRFVLISAREPVILPIKLPNMA